MAQSLCNAAYQQDIEKVKELLEAGADPNENRGGHARTPLHECALNGNLEITKILVKAGGDLSAQYYGNSVLHDAVREQNGDLGLWMLKEANADPYDLNGFGNTLLHLAALYGQFQVVKYLCDERGMDPNAPNQSGATAMQCAFAGGQVEIIRYFTVKSNKDLLLNCSPEEMNFTLAKKFLRDAQSKVSTLNLSNVCFISTSNFLKAGCIPIHAKCVENGWICDGTVLTPRSRILFLSHRWQTAHLPDPDNIQFNVVKNFIETCNIEFDYVWADYSCITQDKASPLFGVHLANIPTALFCSTHCIVVPAVHDHDTSDLLDYLGRGWCQLEAMVSIFTGCETYVTFKVGEEYEVHPKLEPFRGFSLPGGFVLSSENALKDIDPSLKRKARGYWQGITEPISNMKNFVDGCIVIHKDHKDLFEKILTMSFSHEDILQFDHSSNTFLRHLPHAYFNLGNFTSEDDRLVVARLLLFCMAFSMYEFNQPSNETVVKEITAQISENNSNQTEDNDEESPESIITGTNQKDKEVPDAFSTGNAPRDISTSQVQDAQREDQTTAPIVQKRRAGCGCTMM
mmetsp:Transcript_983/g.1273  ORF Transcript_983/g.1273 Transcript_983/m.1273 type:complete len:571 (+) Transcript_983:66-1778(+)